MNEENENMVLHSDDQIMEILHEENTQMESVKIAKSAKLVCWTISRPK